MATDLSAILALVRPPRLPIGLDRSWAQVETELGTRLPDDYKAFVDAYGSGLVCGRIAVWNFRDSAAFKSPLKDALADTTTMRLYWTVMSEGRCNQQYKMFPAANGLFPFGTVVDVHDFSWLTAGDPDVWDIVYWFFDNHEFIHLRGDTFCQFLVKLLKGDYNGRPIARFSVPCDFTDFSQW